MWKKNILVKKRSNAKGLLEEKMFSLQPHFHEALFKHRKMMIDMTKNKFIDICKGTESLTIEKFKEAQVVRQSKCKDEIERVSDNARNNVKDCISKVLKELRDRITGEIFLDEQRKQNNPTQSNNTANMKRKETHDVYTKLGFPPGMTYGHRSSLRKECIKFLRFAYLVDFLSLESLSKIYTASV
jgi:dynein heavy chain